MNAHGSTLTATTASSRAGAAPARAAALPVPLKLIGLVLLAKALVFAAVWFGYARVDLAAGVYQDGAPYHEPSGYGFLTRLTTWDAGHYLRLARDGYASQTDPSNAFAPAFPLLIRGAAQLTGDPLSAGLLVANAASAAACCLLFALVRRRWGEAAAWRALVLLLAFPTAFFLSLVYTEAVFLLLAVLVFYALDRAPADPRWLLLAAAAACLLPLVRPIGVAVALPLAAWAVASFKLQAASCELRAAEPHGSSASPAPGSWFPVPGSSLLPLASCLLPLAPLAGAAAHLVYMQAVTGDAFAHVHAQALYAAQWEAGNLLRPWVFVHELLGRGLSFHGHLDSALDRAFFLAFLVSLPLVWRRVGRVQGIGPPLFLLYAALGLLPPLLGSFMAYTRFLLVAFPLFIAWGGCLAARPRLLRYGVAVMALMQLAAVLAHTSSRWVA